jgi:hypothetical protein
MIIANENIKKEGTYVILGVAYLQCTGGIPFPIILRRGKD